MFQIVYDKVKGKWINKDEDESEAEAFKPPPKLSDLTGSSLMTNNANQNIPVAAPMPPDQRNEMNPVNTYGNPNMPSSNFSSPQISGVNNPDPTVANKVPSLQSNMYKMQRNKSE